MALGSTKGAPRGIFESIGCFREPGNSALFGAWPKGMFGQVLKKWQNIE
jgi:hypothetical protein